MKKIIQTIVLVPMILFVACTKKESFNAKLKVDSKEVDVINSDYPLTRDTTVRQITKKGTNYTGGSALGDSTTAVRTN